MYFRFASVSRLLAGWCSRTKRSLSWTAPYGAAEAYASTIVRDVGTFDFPESHARCHCSFSSRPFRLEPISRRATKGSDLYTLSICICLI